VGDSDPVGLGVPVDYDPETGTYRARFDSETVTPSVAVIGAIADIRDADPERLDPLYEAIDPDALDRVVTAVPTEEDRSVTFDYGGYEVTVSNGGIVDIRPLCCEDREM